MKVTDEMIRSACKAYDDATDAMSDRASFVGMRAALDALSQPVAEAVDDARDARLWRLFLAHRDNIEANAIMVGDDAELIAAIEQAAMGGAT